MYGHLLHPCAQVGSMKGPSDKASLRRQESRDDSCCEVCTPNGFSDLTRRSLGHQRTRSNGSELLTGRSGSKQEFPNLTMRGVEKSSRKNRAWNGNGMLVLFALSLLLIVATCQAAFDGCAPGLKTAGRTNPVGDIVLEDGELLNIYCILDQTAVNPKLAGKNASDLVFFRNNKIIEPELTTIINSTTIALRGLKLPPSSDLYYCKVRLDEDNDTTEYELVCLNKVMVGFKPMEPENFTCVSHNWESLTCSWDPVLNYVATNYILRFHFPGRAGGRAVYSCPQPKDDQPPNTCMLGATTDPIYRQPQPYYNFTLNVSNHFGEKSFPYLFNHYAQVIPSPPVDLKVLNKTFSSAQLYWTIPYPLESFPPGLHSKISYQCLHDQTKTWENIIVTSDTGGTKKRYFNLTNLQYANAPYDVRVFLKSAVAIDENHWSAFSSLTFKTAPTLPGQAPKTDIGSFQVEANSSKRDIYIYWQMIPAFLENGDNFTYQVASFEQNGEPLDVIPSEKTKSYAKFRGMSHEHLKFVIVTANIVGANKTQAVVHVPSQKELLPEPAAFTKIAFENGTHELSWNPSSNAEITNYTIFWCENVRERPYQCKGYLDWVHVSSNTSAYNITVPAHKNYQFAIAANTKRASSGMTWAACTAIHNKYIGKMNSMWMTAGSDSIDVTWKLECSDRIDSIKGFVLYYCPILQPQNDSCKTPEKSETVYGGPHTSRGQLRGLKPYTTYRITIAVLTKNGEGPRSDAMQYPTVEGAPTAPRDLKIKNVTNTSMVVEWNPPEAENGKVRYYTVYYGDEIIKVEQPDGQKVTFVKINDLRPYKKYTVSVSAQTVKEGNRSESKTQITEIGRPGKIEVPKVHFSNATQVQILWDPPREAGGELDYYQIRTKEKKIYNVTTREKFLDISRCEELGSETKYSFQVRAVNLGSQNEPLPGPWSTSGEANCFNIGPSSAVWVIIWIIGCFSGVAFVMFLGYSSNRIWIKCKAMQDVEVKLPPGLQPNSKLLEKGNEQHAKQLSADSSGCSSGQESVTSSLTDSHVSTDSGADLDPVPMSPTKLLEPPPTWESSSNLRQRNVTGTTKPDFSGERGRWDPYVKVAKTMDTQTGDSESLARSTPNLTADEAVAMAAVRTCPMSQPHNWSSTGYISMPSSEDDSSNNPSPLLHGKGSAPGVYSVVGLAPTPTPPRRGTDRSQPRTGDLIPIEVNAREEPIAPNPYVSLASLDPKTKIASDPRIQSIEDFADLDFVHSVREDQPQQQQQQQQQPYSISDKISKPYVQAGPMDAMKVSGRTPETSGGRPTFAPNFGDASRTLSHSLIEIPSNSYVPADTAHSSGINKDSAHVQNPYVAVRSLAPLSDDSSLKNRQADDHLGSSYPLSSQQPATKKSTVCNETAERSAATTLPVIKQTSGYVTIAENPTSSTAPYVQHQQGDKKSPPSYQQHDGPADEQYSKVTVVPTTT